MNLYPEENPPDSDPAAPVTHNLTPGLRLLFEPPIPAEARCAYRASNGKLFYVVGPRVYFVDSAWVVHELGLITSVDGICSMRDNGFEIVLVDGRLNDGWSIDLATHTMTKLIDPAFYGSNRVDYLDAFFLFAEPDTRKFYISNASSTVFNPLNFVLRSGAPDPIQGVASIHKQIWMLGTLTGEIFFNSGAADFPFAAMPGTFIEHGCAAKYSIAVTDVSIFWLGQDKDGKGVVFQGSNYQALKISTYALDCEINSYSKIDDVTSYIYQQKGHTFYVMNFPSADKTWAYDLATKKWHERTWTDENGIEHRHRAQVCVAAYGKIVAGDWETGKLYELDPDTYTDDEGPIVRRRSFPHLVNELKRVTYDSFQADMQVGTQFPSPAIPPEPPGVWLRWSDTRGASWGNPVRQTLGSTGKFLTSPKWNMLGMARDRVFELFWSAPVKTALQAAFIELTKGAS